MQLRIKKWWNSWYFQTHTLSIQPKIVSKKELRKLKLEEIENKN